MSLGFLHTGEQAGADDSPSSPHADMAVRAGCCGQSVAFVHSPARLCPSATGATVNSVAEAKGTQRSWKDNTTPPQQTSPKRRGSVNTAQEATEWSMPEQSAPPGTDQKSLLTAINTLPRDKLNAWAHFRTAGAPESRLHCSCIWGVGT